MLGRIRHRALATTAVIFLSSLLASCDRDRTDTQALAGGSSGAGSPGSSGTSTPPANRKVRSAPRTTGGGAGVIGKVDPGANAVDDDDAGTDGIRSLEAVTLSPRSAAIIWRTPDVADSEVLSGADETLSRKPILQPEPVRRHRVILSGLEPATVYSYKAVSRSASDSLTSDVRTFTTPAVESFTLVDSHPRIFFTSADLPDLRERIAGTHASYWRKLTSWCDSVLGQDNRSLAVDDNSVLYVRGLAFAGLVGNEDRYKKKAENVALSSASLDLTDDYPLRRSALVMAAVYDWLFDDLDAPARATLRSAILKRLQALGVNDREWVWGWNPETFSPLTIGSLAIADEEPEAKKILDDCVYRYRYSILSTWRYYARHGGALEGWWYSAFHLDMFVDTFEGLRTAAGINFYASEPWVERVIEWFVTGLRGDDSFHRVGDAKIFKGLHYSNRRYAELVAKMYGNEQAQWLAHKVEESQGIWGPTAVSDILLLDPSVKATEPSSAASRCFPEAGFVFARDVGGPDAVQVMFRSASDFTLGHTHRDNNSFAIFYKAGQALHSGIYDDFNSDHHKSYYERTIAHNTILVEDPNEVFRRYKEVVTPDGGQRFLLAPEEVSNVMPGSVEEILDPSNGYQAGGIVFYESTPHHTYAMGDAAFSYGASKLSAFDRHFVFLREVSGFAKPVTIVFDRVVSTRASFKKTYLLHTQERPQVKDGLVWAVHKQGMLYQQTVLPDAADIAVVGGPGKEFWVDGRNHPPVHTPQELDEAGQFRVEVSPSTARTTDHFLHLLYATDAGSPAPPQAELIEADTMKGLAAGDHVVLFPAEGKQITSVTYSADGHKTHLLVGLVPLADYDVVLDGTPAQRVKSSYEGTLLFATDGSTIIIVRKSTAGSA